MSLNDIAIITTTPKQFVAHKKMVSKPFEEAGVKLKRNKCALFINCIIYLSHVIKPGQLNVAHYTSDAICDDRVPETATKVHLFLGLFNVFRRSILILQEARQSFPSNLSKLKQNNVDLLARKS